MHRGPSEDDLLEKFPFLKEKNLSDDLKKFLVEKAVETKNAIWSREFELKKWRWTTPLAIALTGAITITINFVFDSIRAQQGLHLQEITSESEAKRKATAEERQFEFKIVEQQLSLSTSVKDRAQVLLFLVRAGLLNNLNPAELKSMAEADLTILRQPSATGGEINIPSLGRRPQPPLTSIRQTGITADAFGGSSDPNVSAYDGHIINDTELGVALPYRFEGTPPKVRIFAKDGKSIVANIVDIGPWNTDDPYWQTGSRPQAESGTDIRGRPTNRTGMALTPALFRWLGASGPHVVIDWAFD